MVDVVRFPCKRLKAFCSHANLIITRNVMLMSKKLYFNLHILYVTHNTEKTGGKKEPAENYIWKLSVFKWFYRKGFVIFHTYLHCLEKLSLNFHRIIAATNPSGFYWLITKKNGKQKNLTWFLNYYLKKKKRKSDIHLCWVYFLWFYKIKSRETNCSYQQEFIKNNIDPTSIVNLDMKTLTRKATRGPL